MEWHQGDMLKYAVEHNVRNIAFSANSTISQNGDLVMGKGAAKTVRDYFPGVAFDLGLVIGRYGVVGIQPDYFVASVPSILRHPDFMPVNFDTYSIHAVQVKRHFSDHGTLIYKQACVPLMMRSLDALQSIVKAANAPFVMNCPLIGGGGFNNEEDADHIRSLVEHILRDVPVIVCLHAAAWHICRL